MSNRTPSSGTRDRQLNMLAAVRFFAQGESSPRRSEILLGSVLSEYVAEFSKVWGPLPYPGRRERLCRVDIISRYMRERKVQGAGVR
jgi:hypothetical protein